MRSAATFFALLASLVVATQASASQCPGNPDALGTSRTIVVDPAEHSLLGSHQYRESLPLNDKEVVLTFDDGPLPPYSTRVLDILASECVKATFFMVGRMARSFPRLVRRTYDEGHTLANHSQNHPFNFHRMSVADAAREIEDAQNAIATAVGDPAKVAPFFRFPGLLRQESVETYLRSRRYMSWSIDVMADDWTRISADQIVERALSRLEAKGKGILLLHDIQPATALGLPNLLRELKARGYRIVHVVPASAERARTATTPEQWMVRQPRAVAGNEPSIWPRVLPVRVRPSGVAMAAPSVMSFGAETAADDVPVTLVSSPQSPRGGAGEAKLPAPWPEQVIMIAVLPEVQAFPAPGEDNFRYQRKARKSAAKKEKRKPRRELTRTADTDVTGSIGEPRSGEPKGFKSGKNGKSAKSTSKDVPSKEPRGHEPRSKERRAGERPTNVLPAGGHQIQISGRKPT